MQPMEIVLLIIGLLLIGISFFMTDRRHNAAEEEKLQKNMEEKILGSGILERMSAELREQVKGRLEDLTDDAMVRTDDQICQISNEKMMSMNEYSEQVLEKINQNHTEVVFLYDMLNEKEKDLKDFSKNVEGMKNELMEIASEIQKQLMRAVPKAKNAGASEMSAEPFEEEKAHAPQAVHTARKSQQREEHAAGAFQNNNEEILKLHSEGKSILEISKLLGLGQGEVKLVIGLFQNAKEGLAE